MIEGSTDKETIELNVQLLGMSEQTVREALAIERGEQAGDIEILGEDGQPLEVAEQVAILYGTAREEGI